MKITRRPPSFLCHTDAGNFEILFLPVKNTPGFSHRVSITKTPSNSNLVNVVNWLSSEFRPSIKTATFFFEKHVSPDGTITPRRRLRQSGDSSTTPDKQLL